MNILIVKPSSLGDIIHAFPAVHALRVSYPDAFISWLVADNFEGLVELSPDVDEIIIFKRKEMGQLKNFGEISKLIKELRQRDFDLVFDFQGLFRSAFFSKMTKASQVIGFSNAREFAPWFYTKKVKPKSGITHAIDKNNLLVDEFIVDRALPYCFPELKTFEDCRKSADDLISSSAIDRRKTIVAIAPQSRWESKTWPPKFFADVIQLVLEEVSSVEFWLLGTKAEASAGNEIVSLCKKSVVHNLMGRTNLVTMVELLRSSDALVTNDSGPMHIASALNKKVFALFGPTDPELTGPYSKTSMIYKGDIGCGSCRKKICSYPVGERCQDKVNAQQVATDLIEFVKNNKEKSNV
ncbi:MAG: lipopolysaccharide heptosyltransferase II [Lentisphaeria bacterium]|nr:lipopolysaccharide heptosyltransferase II [Lentisphaeria bacterium]